MPDFISLKHAISHQFDLMKKYDMFRVQVEKNDLWDMYLKSFPEGTNPIFRERTEHDCQCCKSFIRSVGDLVAIINGKLVSIWDVKADGFYQVVADAMSALVKSKPIQNQFLHTESSVGIDKSPRMVDGVVLVWNHFHLKLPATHVVRGADIGPRLSESRSSKDVLFRSLTEITDDSINTVLELIGQKSLYRGEEHEGLVKAFKALKEKFSKLTTDTERDIFCWSSLKTGGAVCRIRNSVIGSLLVDISEGKDLEHAVNSFEAKVAPMNYKRPTALVTKAMVEKARATVHELGLDTALERRYATIDDITVNNILFADREAKKKMSADVFGIVANSIPEKVKNFDKVEEIDVETFLKNVLPKAESLEVFVENRHASNLVSLIAPADPSAKGMFKWPNNFSWSYTGEVADSIKERVKQAGGKVDGDLRCSLSWFNHDDLDLHMMEPGGNEISFRRRYSAYTGGVLDVDMNAGEGTTRTPVENICYPNRTSMKEGTYRLEVNNFYKRENKDFGFDMEIEFDGAIHHIHYENAVADKATITVAKIKYTHKGGFEILESLQSSKSSKEVWGVTTESFHKASVVMLSPNHWDDKVVGNKHVMFMLDGCVNDGQARGFFNEFLAEELTPHRKVLEVVGSKMKTDTSDHQLSGIGFSSTQRNSVLCRVKGSFNRVVKVVF